MARNEEKARSMLNRWQEMKREERFGRVDRRPSHTSMEESVERSMQWRAEIVKECAKMIAEIQSDTLDEHRLRDLNDQINKKMRLKRAWEHRIVELGGPNYLGQHNISFPDMGVAPDMKGGAYRYYGAAKNLPGVRELLKSAMDSEHRATQSIEQIQRAVDVSYYGYLDDDDGILAPLEEKATKRAMVRRTEEWEEESKRVKTERAALGAGAAAVLAAEETKNKLSSVDEGFISHVTLPSKDEIEKLIVARRKQELLKQYASTGLQDELEKTAKAWRPRSFSSSSSIKTPYLSNSIYPLMDVTDTEYRNNLDKFGATLKDPNMGMMQEDCPPVVERIQRESIVMLGGPAAVVMQLAHPFIAYGVNSHSYLMSKDGIRRRYYQTFKYMFGVMFGSWDTVRDALITVRGMHRKIKGTIPEDLPGGAYRAGDEFDALSESAAYWVHATLVWNSVWTYEMFCGALSEVEKEQFYQWHRRGCVVWGLRTELTPATWNDFDAYVQAMCASNFVTPSKPATQYCKMLLCPLLHEKYIPGLNSGRVLATIQIPEPLTKMFGLALRPWEYLFVVVMGAITSTLYRLAPHRFRWYTQYNLRQHRIFGGSLDFIERAGLWFGEFFVDVTMKGLV